jgi:hypothetical protein
MLGMATNNFNIVMFMQPMKRLDVCIKKGLNFIFGIWGKGINLIRIKPINNK